MTIKNIQLKDLEGNELLPKTSGALVINGSGAETYDLSTVEEGAQVNVLEGVQLNGTDITIDANKKANIVLPAAAEYTIAKDATAGEGYSATYHLTKDGVNVGEAINIPKDMVVESGDVKTCVEADVPVEGYKVGDKYIDLVIANSADSHLYILVSDLIDIYTEGDGINISNNQISVDTTDTAIVDATPTASSTKLVQSGGVYTQLATKVDANTAITGATHTKITYDAKGLVTAGEDLAEADIPALHLAKITDVTATATEVNYLSGTTSNVQDQINSKQATITGAATTVVDTDLTPSMVLVSDSNGKIAASAIPAASALLVWEEITE